MDQKAIEEFRITELGLSADVVAIALRFDPPSDEDKECGAQATRRYDDGLRKLQQIIALEQGSQSQILTQLSGAESLCRHRIMACRSILAPWRRLPLEIWDRIFAFFIGAAIDRFNNEYGKLGTTAPGTLSRVCRVWQAVIQQTPSIWTDLTILAGENERGGTPYLS
ncbi:hypothetical protein FA13DRAFT_1737862 [Coprinellus micaceus]|uniref:Uncharacterized protein n=1 Tax=Coprinellus micaceus TaxID=71717 RepID=A0A4Y7SVV3_COPMI|nr:hypothetical protein FA13DRAFT_1737862 [Coprinellus micaceus]